MPNNLRNLVVTVFVAWASARYCLNAKAGLPYPSTWSRESDDGKYLFVMLSPEPIADEVLNADDAEEIRFIRETYSKSGLYPNNGSTQPIWEYTGYWRGRSVIIAPDGEHLIFPGEWTWNGDGFQVVDFIRHGQTIRSYHDFEVIPQYKLKWLMNGLKWPTCSETSFNPKLMTYSVSTNQGETITFDVTTGDVVAVNSPFPTLYLAAGMSIATLVVVIVSLRRRIHRKATA